MLNYITIQLQYIYIYISIQPQYRTVPPQYILSHCNAYTLSNIQNFIAIVFVTVWIGVD